MADLFSLTLLAPLDGTLYEKKNSNMNQNLGDQIFDAELNALHLVKSKKSSKKCGGFQSMGLSYPVLKGILRKGYKFPTPIQRKAIPYLMKGQDVVAMARTGSGKTAAFLIPMFEKLKVRSAKSGVRALILSPTHELALQTLKFIKELGKMTRLNAILIMGGNKLEDQFAAIHGNPDIIVATPGRLLHLIIEMDLKLASVEYIVFDEADRLFEKGFQVQLEEILHRLPENRQTLLFSATLPRVLIDFAKAGLDKPEIIRLDADLTINKNIKKAYICCRSDDKPSVLLHLLKNVLNLDELTVIFLATRHHVEYVKELLSKASIPCTYIYSSLDQTARNIHMAKFKSRKVSVLLVTDIAARGIDIPLLDNVINYHFPAKPKLFLHRVGRVGRGNRTGTAYSLVAPDETAYLLDLHLFYGESMKYSEENCISFEDGICGSVPQTLIDDEADILMMFHETSGDLKNISKVACNAYKQYVKSRASPSNESVKRAKEFSHLPLPMHPIFHGMALAENERNKLLTDMKNYHPKSTIFEIGATVKNQATVVMRIKRLHHNTVINKARNLKFGNLGINEDKKEYDEVNRDCGILNVADHHLKIYSTLTCETSCCDNISEAKCDQFKDTKNFLPYRSSNHYSDKGLELENNFDRQAAEAMLEITGDDAEEMIRQKNVFRWDRKKKRFIKGDEVDLKKKKIKTESGVWIPKTYKSDLYKKWKEKNKIVYQQDCNNVDKNQFEKMNDTAKGKLKLTKNLKKNRNIRPEMKSKEEILKARERKSRLNFHQKRRQAQRSQKKESNKRRKKR